MADGRKKPTDPHLFGAGFRMVQEAEAGTVCAVTGLSHTRAGEGLGVERGRHAGNSGAGADLSPDTGGRNGSFPAAEKSPVPEEEEPMLHISREEQSGEIFVQVMGPVQMEIIGR